MFCFVYDLYVFVEDFIWHMGARATEKKDSDYLFSSCFRNVYLIFCVIYIYTYVYIYIFFFFYKSYC